MTLMELINRLERKAKWKVSSEHEVNFGCTVLLVVVLLTVMVVWMMSK